jgi:hypothetical protein
MPRSAISRPPSAYTRSVGAEVASTKKEGWMMTAGSVTVRALRPSVSR